MSVAISRRSAPCLLACAWLLTACAPPAPQVLTVNEIQRVVLRPPAPLLECLPDPEPPKGDDLDAVPVYLLRLWAAGADCRERLDAVKRWAEKEEP